MTKYPNELKSKVIAYAITLKNGDKGANIAAKNFGIDPRTVKAWLHTHSQMLMYKNMVNQESAKKKEPAKNPTPTTITNQPKNPQIGQNPIGKAYEKYLLEKLETLPNTPVPNNTPVRTQPSARAQEAAKASLPTTSPIPSISTQTNLQVKVTKPAREALVVLETPNPKRARINSADSNGPSCARPKENSRPANADAPPVINENAQMDENTNSLSAAKISEAQYDLMQMQKYVYPYTENGNKTFEESNFQMGDHNGNFGNLSKQTTSPSNNPFGFPTNNISQTPIIQFHFHGNTNIHMGNGSAFPAISFGSPLASFPQAIMGSNSPSFPSSNTGQNNFLGNLCQLIAASQSNNNSSSPSASNNQLT